MLSNAPLRRQLLLLLLLPIAVVWLASAYVTYAIAYRFATSAYDRALLDSALALAGQVRVEAGRVAVDLPRIAQKVLESDLSDRVYYMVSGPDGAFVMGYRGMPVPPANTVMRPADEIGGTIRYYDAEYRGEAVRIAALDVSLSSISDGGLTGQALVQVGETLIDRREMARDILAAILLPQVALMFMLAGIIWFAVGRGLAPLDALSKEIESRSSRDLTPVTEEHAPPEVRRLVGSLNGLLARVAQTLAAQQRFIANAAHQLRTPTAALKTQVELAQRAVDPAETRSRLASIHLATERNARLVNQLLSLARAEPGGTEQLDQRPLDLIELARAAAAQWVPQALARSIDLGFEALPGATGGDRGEGGQPQAPLMVTGDPVMLTEMLANLIDNALRYTPPGGAVTVGVRRTGDPDHPAARLTVEDNGPGVAQAERERVFERFYRVLGTGTEGAGLGLAIVREIALAHGGQVELGEGADGVGTRVEVTLPVA